jgi:two-component system nitrate/nitrite response regulator NarL
MCVAVNELREGDGAIIGRALRRHGNTRVIVLARRAARRELVGLLGNGIRGAVVAESMVPVAARRSLVLVVPRDQEEADSDPSTVGVTLTEREVGVLQLVAAGQTNRQVGEQLNLSALTVKSHLARISRKMGTGERAELVAIAIRSGLLL